MVSAPFSPRAIESAANYMNLVNCALISMAIVLLPLNGLAYAG